ncbi:MAG: cation:proton antiporter [Verrucomicrobiota bacterium]|nr:cation:proton antiporter [Verrucomicrobiota bacterium]
MDEGILFLKDLAILLVFAGVFGLFFRSLKLSSIVGFLAAGLIIGPHSPIVELIDEHRVHTFSHLGLVLVMFFVGLHLSLAKLRKLGLAVVLATATTSIVVFFASRFFAHAMGWSANEGLFLAGMLMISSSAIITKVMAEARLTHERFAQRALGMVVMEDIVAVVMLTILSGHAVSGASNANPFKTLLLLAGLVILMVVIGLSVIPPLLKHFSKSGNLDVKTILVAGLVFLTAYATYKANFSPALGAFLFGMIVAETPFREKVEKALMGTQDIFSAVFFVAIGMMIDIHSLMRDWQWILAVSVLTIGARMVGATLGSILGGSTFRSAVCTAMLLIPIGEFSYVIAQMGLEAGMPTRLFSIAVGVSVITAAIVPILARFSDGISGKIDSHAPKIIFKLIDSYGRFTEEISRTTQQKAFLNLARNRLGHALIELFLIAGVLSYSGLLKELIDSLLIQAGWDFPVWMAFYWSFVFVIVALVLVAVWRNFEALILIILDGLTAGSDAISQTQAMWLRLIHILAVICLFLWMVVFLPFESLSLTTLTFMLVGLGLFIGIFWTKLIRWHSKLQISFNQALEENQMPGSFKNSLQMDWNVELSEFTVSEDAQAVGQTLVDLDLRNRFSCSIIEIERNGVVISNPNPEEMLFPEDKVLLFGDEEYLRKALEFLSRSKAHNHQWKLSDTALETISLPDYSPLISRSLAQLGIQKKTGVQVLGIHREGKTILNPLNTEHLIAYDALLILCTPSQFDIFSQWVRGKLEI